MFNYKGIRVFYAIADSVLLMQMFKITNFASSVDVASFVAFFLTIGTAVKLVVFDGMLKGAKYWLLIGFMILQEVVIGIDKHLSLQVYNLSVVCMLIISMGILYSLDMPSVRKHMDEDAYVLKNACSILAITYGIAAVEIVLDYMYPPFMPM